MKKLFQNNRWKVFIFAGILVVFSLGLAAFHSSREFKYTKSLDIFFTLFRELNLYYVDEADPENLIRTAIDEMLESLDPYTTYIPESDLDDFNLMTTGKYGGIGSLVRKRGEHTIISEVYQGFPADQAGLKPGDVLLEVDGKSIRALALNNVSDLLKGLPNSRVEITFLREGTEKAEKKTLTRKVIQIPSVPYAGIIDDGIAYIRLSNFTQGSAGEIKKVLLGLKETQHLNGLILDLRSNPGGLLIEAVDIANLFVEKGAEIVSTKGRIQQWNSVYRARNAPVDNELPMVVLVNRISASASEIVAGSLQDLDRAVIIGHRTFGKGLVQTTRPLSYNSRLKVTTAKYYIPSGRCIQALDYTNRNEDGSVGHIPDSLISAFQTLNGRIVYDGGGIQPDILATPHSLSRIATALYTNMLIFDYATHFADKYKSIDEPQAFRINDEIYEDFNHFVNGKDFDYLSETEESLDLLIEKARKEKYYELSEESFQQLKETITHNKDNDMIHFRNEIEQLLQEEIVGRFYYQQGRIRAGLDGDVQVQKAIEILKDPGEYAGILQVRPEGKTASLAGN